MLGQDVRTEVVQCWGRMSGRRGSSALGQDVRTER